VASEVIEAFLERYGPERLIFGSDYPFGVPGPQLRGLGSMGIGNDDLRKVVSGNILRLLR